MPEEQKVTRKLRAILSADVKGCSLLMEADEAFTIQTLKAFPNAVIHKAQVTLVIGRRIFGLNTAKTRAQGSVKAAAIHTVKTNFIMANS